MDEIKKDRAADALNRMINVLRYQEVLDTNKISDGFHTIGELYAHRIELWITVCRLQSDLKFKGTIVWKSKFHDDGSTFEGWFVLGIILLDGKQLSYHLPNEKWEYCSFATTLPKAPNFDGHTSADVLARLKHL